MNTYSNENSDAEDQEFDTPPETNNDDANHVHLEPWPTPVIPDEVMAEIIVILERHTIMTHEEVLAVALWIAHSHCVELFRHSPFLALQSPTMRCGKSTTLGAVAALVPRPVPLAHVTGASLFRLIHDENPTVLIDELDQVIHRNKELRAVLNTAHCRSTAFIPRIVRGKTVRFRVFGPKVVAGIGKLPDTIQDRCIVINLRRKGPDEKVEPLPLKPEEFYADTHRKILRMVLDLGGELAASDPALPAGMNDRACDNWRPLLRVAAALGPKWLAIAKRSAVSISRQSDAESVDPAEQLIRDIKGIFTQARGATFLPVEDLHSLLLDIDVGLWAEFERGQPLSKARLGRMLVPFGILSRVKRIGSRVARVYCRADFEDAFSRYCPDKPGRGASKNRNVGKRAA